MDIAPQIDEGKLNDFGVRLQKVFEQYKLDRKAAEDKWLRNLRQFRGIYDPEVKIAADASKAYPKLTRWKVIGTVARLMQMLFPQTEKNWGLEASPIPQLPTAALQRILDDLVTEAAGEGGDPRAVELDPEVIEKAIRAEAKKRADKMALKVDDDLRELEYPTLVRRVVFSAALYNVGVLKGPTHKRVKARTWTKDVTGRYVAQEVDKLKPVMEFLPVWQWYPDMSALTLDKQDGTFERHVGLRDDLKALADQPGFMADRVNDWLEKHAVGNHSPLHWETTIRAELKGDKNTVTETETRKYEWVSYWGSVTAHELRAAGVKIKDEDLSKSFQANVWMIDKTVIKAALQPLGTDARIHHEFMFEEDELSLLGNGQCDTLRDSQISLCEVTRAALDNSSVIGTQVEVNKDLLAPGQSYALSKHKVWIREGDGAAATYPAVRNVNIDSHLPELSNMMSIFMEFADKESGLPPQSLGDVSGGGSEALRTQKNASMFLGAAALPIRDTVRNFDTFTTSVITSVVKWNMKFDPDESRDGDPKVIARGSTSLIAKEVLAESLDALRAGVTQDEAPHIDTRKLLIERMKARDLPIEQVLVDEDTANATIAAQQQAQQAAQAKATEEVDAKIRETLTRALKNAAQARQADGDTNVSTFTAIIEALENGTRDDKSGTARTA